jgi:hypothetical protein
MKNTGVVLSLTSVLDGVGGQRHAPAALPQGNIPGTNCIGGWVGPRAGLENLAPSGPDLRNFQPVVSRHTDWAIVVTLYKR